MQENVHGRRKGRGSIREKLGKVTRDADTTTSVQTNANKETRKAISKSTKEMFLS